MTFVRNVFMGGVAALVVLAAAQSAHAQEAQEMGYFETPEQSASEQRSAQAHVASRGKHGVRLFLDVDVFRWTRERAKVDTPFGSTTVKLSAVSVGPNALGLGAVTNLISAGAGVGLNERLVLNGAFGLGRLKSDDAGIKTTSLRLLPDLDVLLMTSGKVRPYATAGLPVSIALNKGAGQDFRAFSIGPQFGLGALFGPIHAEMTFGALFGRIRDDGQGATFDQRITELTIALTVGASYWL